MPPQWDPPPSCIDVGATQRDLAADLGQDGVSEERVIITNPCEGTLELTGLELVGDDAEYFGLRGLDEVLYGPGDEGSFVVEFRPDGARTYRAAILIESNAEDEPETFIDLIGVAR